MRTANNGRFLGFLENSSQATMIKNRQKELLSEWKANKKILPSLETLLKKFKNDFQSVVEPLKEEFNPTRELKLKRGELYHIVPEDDIATEDDFKLTYDLRKEELKSHWQKSAKIKEAYTEFASKFENDFCKICNALLLYTKKQKISFSELGLRSGESYVNEEDGPRVATIYNGLHGKRVWVSFRKGDPDGNKWTDNEPLFISWSKENVDWLSTNPQARWQGQNMFFTAGTTYTLMGNHVALKAKLQPPCVFDAGASRLSPVIKQLSIYSFLAILNSNVYSFFVRKFIKNTVDYEINDIRMSPIVIPTAMQGATLDSLAQHAVKAKELVLEAKEPSVELIQYAKGILRKQKNAPPYLQPNPQILLLASSQDCLDVIELAIQWEVEILYGVEGAGPFNEF